MNWKDCLNTLSDSAGIFREEKIAPQKIAAGFLPVAVLTLLFWCAEYILSDGLISRDGYSYLGYVQEAVDHGWDAARCKFPEIGQVPPLLLMAMYYPALPGIDAVWAGRAANLLGVLSLAAGVWFCSLRIYKNFQLALATSLMVMAIPRIYETGCNILRDPVYWGIAVWIFYLVLSMTADRLNATDGYPGKLLRKTATLAILSGAALITRKEGLFLVPLTGLWLAVTVLPDRRLKSSRRIIVVILFIILAAAVSIVPYAAGTGWYPAKSLLTDLSYLGIL